MPDEICVGYQREPHSAQIVAEREYLDGSRDKLCVVCYTRWQLSEEEWPPNKTTHKSSEVNQPPLSNSKKVV
jgi:hypothetical protein